MSKKHLLIVAAKGGETDQVAGYLENQGFQIKVACGKTEAMSAFQQRRDDIVLVDADLPGLFLDEFVKAILALRSATKIIVITTTERPSELCEAVQSGVTCYAKKPVDRERLFLQIQKF